jgi:hypothetical protein
VLDTTLTLSSSSAPYDTPLSSDRRVFWLTGPPRFYSARGNANVLIMPQSSSKISSLDGPQWADFRGFSLLFDNPGTSLREADSYLCLDSSLSNSFYRKLHLRIRETLPTPTAAQGLALLPLESLHVTAIDGVNDRNLSNIAPSYRSETRSFLRELPQSIADPPPVASFLANSVLAKTPWAIKLQLEEMVIWSESVLAARLSPTEPGPSAQQESYAAFEAARRELGRKFARRFGPSVREPFVPHVTLGYFNSPAAGRTATRRLPRWSRSICTAMHNESISLSKVRLYGFTDMITFVCRG